MERKVEGGNVDGFDAFVEELQRTADQSLLPLFQARDASARLLEALPRVYPPGCLGDSASQAQRAWELSGLFFLNQGRYYEALSIFTSLYYAMLRGQDEAGRLHKGMPLVWIADCYSRMGFPVHTKRYLMLTLCEDAIRENGVVSPENTGIYFRLVWLHGVPESDLLRYARRFNDLAVANPERAKFPEWILQQVDQTWMTELPSPGEAGVYVVNPLYVTDLLQRLGDGSGTELELLAEYLLSCMPGCRTTRRPRSGSTDYDILCAVEGFEVDFRSELGRYFVCEAKDWDKPADFTAMAKFCRVLDSIKSRFGILFAKRGISGQGETRYAEREQLKVFQDRGIVIVVVDEEDLERVAAGGHFTQMLREKYEAVRLDLRPSARVAG
jgi:hypothetical protein